LARLLDERVPPERLLVERGLLAVERDAVDRDPDAREVDARELEAREPEARDAVERVALRAVPEVERDVLRVERDEEADARVGVSALRRVSNSLSACLLVLAASRRSARSAAVTSL
jgi:hypothetical protein